MGRTNDSPDGPIRWDADQQKLLADKCYEGIVFIDSVPGCGKTTVLTEAARELHEGNTLIISLTNSVREGTSRMVQDMLRRAKERYTCHIEGNHNVFTREGSQLGDESGVSHIHIATLDSWVHDSLAELDGGLDDLEAEDYSGKRRRLLQFLQHGHAPAQSFLAYRQIAVDEVQDLDEAFFHILLEVAKYCNKDRRMLLVGDRYQNVFAKGNSCIMERIEMAAEGGSLPKYRSHRLNYNHRCPPAHLKFINKIFESHGREILWPDDKPNGELPIVVQLPKGRSKTILEKQAACIMNLIEKCVVTDGYSLSDIVILSPVTSNNRLYGQLEHSLKQKYERFGHEKVAWLYNDGGDSSVDWKSAHGKIVLSSIHANKGRTHKVVIACDFTDGILPKHHALRDIQVKAQISQALVALSRATERLIIPYAPPLTRFVASGFNCVEEMAKYCTYLTYSSLAQVEPLCPQENYKPIEKTRAPSTVGQLATEMSIEYASGFFELDEPLFFGVQLDCDTMNHPNDPNDPDDTQQSRPVTCNSSLLPAIMHRNHLAPVFGYFGQISLFKMLELGLPARLSAYLHPIVTSSYAVAKQYAWERERWLDHMHDNPEMSLIAYWNQVVREHSLTDDPHRSGFQWTDFDVREARKVGAEIASRGGPEHCVVMHDSVSRQPVIKTIQKEIQEYLRSDSESVTRMTYWNLAVAMCGLHNGIFEQRPWLRTLINNPPMDLDDGAYTTLIENSKRIALIFQGQIKHSEFTVRSTIDGFPMQGRLDMCLKNGTILDVKCPTTKEPKVDSRDWNQLSLYVGLMHQTNQRPNGQVILLDLSHGVYTKGHIRGSFDGLLQESANMLKDKGYTNALDTVNS